MTVEPLSLKSPLANNPQNGLQFAKKVRLKSGEEIDAADPSATRALVALMDMQAVIGGAASHFGGPSAFAELMSATHALMFQEAKANNKQWHEMFHFVNDAGHCENGIYALKANYGFADLSLQSLRDFRSIKSKLTGHGEAHLFPEGVYLSNGPLGSGVPQSQGLAMADALAGRKRVTITAVSDGACMEGETKEALAAIPGLAKRGQMAPYILVISDNNTKLSGRIDEDAFSMQETFESLNSLGWEVMELKNAHDLQACVECMEYALEKAQGNPKKPVAIHARTIKGYGVKATADSSSGGHGFPLKKANELTAFLSEIYGDAEVPSEFTQWIEDLIKLQNEKTSSSSSEPKEKVQVGVSNALCKAKEKGLPVVSITSDLPGSTGVADFRKKFPESSFDVGVAEANMVSVAAGFSKEGYIPVVDTFAQFGVTKGALPLIMSALSQAPVIAVFSHAGFQDAADGASHQALSYIAMTNSIPHTQVYCLSTSEEAEALVMQAVEEFAEKRKQNKTPDSYIFFLGRETFAPSVGNTKDYQLRSTQTIFDNSDKFENSVTIATCGPLVHQALLAAETLANENLGSVVVNTSCVNKPDLTNLQAAVQKTSGRLLTVEDHQLIGGLGANLCHQLSLAGEKLHLKSLGVKGEFGQSAYKANELYAKHNLDAKAIVEAVKSF